MKDNNTFLQEIDDPLDLDLCTPVLADIFYGRVNPFRRCFSLITHTVLPGETLWSIAARYGVTPQVIMRANGITNPNSIFVGTTLRIPVGQQQPPFQPPPYQQFPSFPGGGNLERRVSRLEVQVDNLTRRVRRLEQGR